MTNTTNESEAMEVWFRAKETFAALGAVLGKDGRHRDATDGDRHQAAARVIATALEAAKQSVAEKAADMHVLVTAKIVEAHRAALEARGVEIAELKGALGELIHTAGEVHRLGARTGTQWFRLSGSLIGARAIFTKGEK